MKRTEDPWPILAKTRELIAVSKQLLRQIDERVKKSSTSRAGRQTTNSDQPAPNPSGRELPNRR